MNDEAPIGNPHEYMERQIELAEMYAQDGAFMSAAGVLRRLAGKLEDHARWAMEPFTKTGEKP